MIRCQLQFDRYDELTGHTPPGTSTTRYDMLPMVGVLVIKILEYCGTVHGNTGGIQTERFHF
jgi:hypothetical protein